MQDEEVLALYSELIEYYGDSLVNFEHYPKIFLYQVKLYRYYRGQNAKQ